jgi:5-formyltetrahydrofolate cyclo-ligase
LTINAPAAEFMHADEEKARLRAIARERRAAAHKAIGYGVGERLRNRFVAAMSDMGMPGVCKHVSAYWPFGSEMDVRRLLSFLNDLGFNCALPVVVARNEPLIFRRWQPDTALEQGPIGTRHPGPGQATVTPDTVLAPLLAFDAQGYRLGQGGGYYDRTLARLRARGTILAVGIAYAAQEVEAVPRSPHDEPLDWIVTEEKAFRIPPAERARDS